MCFRGISDITLEAKDLAQNVKEGPYIVEYLDIVDETGRPTGEKLSREIAHRDGVLHRTAHVWVIRSSAGGYDVLLQKRSMEKESFPGLFDTFSKNHLNTQTEKASG